MKYVYVYIVFMVSITFLHGSENTVKKDIDRYVVYDSKNEDGVEAQVDLPHQQGALLQIPFSDKFLFDRSRELVCSEKMTYLSSNSASRAGIFGRGFYHVENKGVADSLESESFSYSKKSKLSKNNETLFSDVEFMGCQGYVEVATQTTMSVSYKDQSTQTMIEQAIEHDKVPIVSKEGPTQENKKVFCCC